MCRCEWGFLWEVVYDNPNHWDDIATAMALDSAGNAIITGLRASSLYTDVQTLKFRCDGWGADLGKTYTRPGASADGGNAVAVDASDNVIVTGYSADERSEPDVYTVKYTPDGSILWERHFAGPSGFGDIGRCVVIHPDGDVIVSGDSGFAVPVKPDYYTVRYAAEDGAERWKVRYDGPLEANSKPQAVAIDAEGNVLVAGFNELLKYSAATGAGTWQAPLPRDPFTFTETMAVDLHGDPIVVGSVIADANTDLWIAKFKGTDGSMAWERRFDGGREDRAKAIAVDAYGNIVVTGISRGPSNAADYYTTKYSPNGTPLRAVRSDGNANDSDILPVGVVVDSNGHVIVTGTSDSSAEEVTPLNTRRTTARCFGKPGTMGEADHDSRRPRG